MSNDMIKVGIIGTGAVAQVVHIPTYQKLEDVELYALCDVDIKKAKQIAERYHIPHVFENYQDLLALPEIGAVDICTPNDLHHTIALEAFAAGKHVLCERPLGRNAEETATAVDASQKAGKILMVGFNNRFREDAQLLRKFIEKGELGEIFYIKTGWLRRKQTFIKSSWQTSESISGGGVFMDLGVTMLDLGMWLIGSPRVESVTASLHYKVHQQNVEDSAAVMIRFENDITMMVEVTWGLLGDKDFSYLNVFGSHGGALLNPLRIHKEMHDSMVNLTPAIESRSGNVYKMSYEREIKHFIEHVKSGKTPLCSGEEALKVMRIVDAIYQSAQTKKVVEL